MYGWFRQFSCQTFLSDVIVTYSMSLRMIKQTKWLVRPEKTQISGHPPSLIRVFAVCMKKPRVFRYPLTARWRLWSDWTHRSFCWLCQAVAHFIFQIQTAMMIPPRRIPKMTMATWWLVENARFAQSREKADWLDQWGTSSCGDVHCYKPSGEIIGAVATGV